MTATHFAYHIDKKEKWVWNSFMKAVLHFRAKPAMKS